MPVNTNEIENVFNVKLQHPTIRSRKVVFDVTPDLIENRNVTYKTLEPVHMPGQIYVFGTTASRTFNISNARLISRTREEAECNLQRLQILRAWTMPAFGKGGLTSDQLAARGNTQSRTGDGGPDMIQPGTQQIGSTSAQRRDLYGVERLGDPPEFVELSAYSAVSTLSTGQKTGGRDLRLEHIRRVPCVIQQLSIPYPSDVDYIPSISGIPMPTIMTIDMTLIETHSPREYEQFSLSNFRNGILRGF
jgi:hypothetical protein